MDEFVTVLITAYPQQLWIVKGRLEAEGIPCFVKDELTVQSYNLLSNAVGGVKLQVQKQYVEHANSLLFELGYKKVEPIQDDLLTRLNKGTTNIPILSKLSIVARIILLTGLGVTLLTALIYYLIKPSNFELLSKQQWCIDKIYYKGKLVGPNSLNTIFLTYNNGQHPCSETADFDESGNLRLPGINSSNVDGNWKKKDNETIQLHVDTLGNIFEGSYKMDVSENQFVLTSSNTVIYAHIDGTTGPNPFKDLMDNR